MWNGIRNVLIQFQNGVSSEGRLKIIQLEEKKVIYSGSFVQGLAFQVLNAKVHYYYWRIVLKVTSSLTCHYQMKLKST